MNFAYADLRLIIFEFKFICFPSAHRPPLIIYKYFRIHRLQIHQLGFKSHHKFIFFQ
jgi:hypothetical protein